ncbi:ABC transporter ATP-binding protein [Prochlorococcus sp. MIT 1341]|uniref:ABC transporter ATP-binding protein n=1 Tax=Prochlorococcus sp. MIT 1341 TaxID=3096221 RepID=UPI002A7553E9|nr:ABC transporter ATP-binding protein [Prochlorococcus sp. MIT 1341]
MKMIELEGIQKSFGSIEALCGLELTVPEGSLYGLLGPNGAGKTSTLRIITTLLAPDSGRVQVSGINALTDPDSVRSQLGYVAQEVAIDKILTGRELLEFQADLYHLNHERKMEMIASMIKRLEMDSWIDRRCGTYSGGMRRRLDLAAGLLHQPQLLVLDEPTVGLDMESRTIVWELLTELKSKGVTILLSSHYLEEIEIMADHIAIIDKGRVIAEGTPDQLKNELGGDRVTLRVREFSDENESNKVRKLLENVEGVKQVVVNRSQGFSLNLVVDGETVLPRLREQLCNANFPIFALAQSRPSLDDVYLQATGRTLMDAELAVAGKRDSKLEAKQRMR